MTIIGSADNGTSARTWMPFSVCFCRTRVHYSTDCSIEVLGPSVSPCMCFFFDKKLVAVYAYAIYFASQIVKRGLHRTGLEGRTRRSFVPSILMLESSGIAIQILHLFAWVQLRLWQYFFPQLFIWQWYFLVLIYYGYSDSILTKIVTDDQT